jgi:4-amino-4-deoxy-L-arabinose transferase-like glycosyltransferase
MLEFVLAHPTALAPRLETTPRRGFQPQPQRRTALLWIFSLWLAIFFASLFTPPLLDDADATHAQAAQSMLQSGDWVTLHVDGIRYLEKPPLPYWIAALSLRAFGQNAFAIHLPLALTVLALALLGYLWSRRAFGDPTALYTAIFLLTSAGVFLFTRIFIPDALLSLLLALSLYCLLRALEPTTDAVTANKSVILSGARGAESKDPDAARIITIARIFQPHGFAYLMWTALALAVLAKGLVALVFFFGTAAVFLPLSGQLFHWRRLRPFTGMFLLLAIAAPWHILAGLRNTHGADGHGFFWFYFVNEHLLRFLARRIPRDYNKLPTALYWSLHLIWLFPWSLFAPAALLTAWPRRHELLARPSIFPRNTILLLLIFSALVLVFFSLSTNQEYYTFPVYLPLLMLLAATLASSSLRSTLYPLHSVFSASFAAFTLLGLTAALTLAYGLWTSRHLPYNPDIGALLARRGIGDYTLSMSHFFDLTGPSFAALRLPAVIAALAFTLGPPLAWILHARRRTHAALLTVALTSAAFLVAAHIALARFAPMLSSQDFAARILTLEQQNAIAPDTQILIFGDQSFGSSIPFYLNRRVTLVDGRSTSMLFGSSFPDAPPVFLTSQQLLAEWGHGPRKILFVPAERRNDADRLLPHALILAEASGKALLTDRLLNSKLTDSKLKTEQDPAPHE